MSAESNQGNETSRPHLGHRVPARFCFGVIVATAWFVSGIFLFAGTLLTHPIGINPYVAMSILLTGLALFATVIAGILENPVKRRQRALQSSHGTRT